MSLTIINPTGAIDKGRDFVRGLTDVGVFGFLGLLATKAVKTLVAMGASYLPTGFGQYVNPAAAGIVGQTVGGALAVIGTETLAPMVVRDNQRLAAMRVGAFVEFIGPFWGQYLAPKLPEPLRSTLGAYYMVPVSGSYATRLAGYAPGDFGDAASPNYPALAGDWGNAPDFNRPSQFAQSLTGDPYLFNPALNVY